MSEIQTDNKVFSLEYDKQGWHWEGVSRNDITHWIEFPNPPKR